MSTNFKLIGILTTIFVSVIYMVYVQSDDIMHTKLDHSKILITATKVAAYL